MTAGELREMLSIVPDDTEVLVACGDTIVQIDEEFTGVDNEGNFVIESNIIETGALSSGD
jgi:hypothetical protein